MYKFFIMVRNKKGGTAHRFSSLSRYRQAPHILKSVSSSRPVQVRERFHRLFSDVLKLAVSIRREQGLLVHLYICRKEQQRRG